MTDKHFWTSEWRLIATNSIFRSWILGLPEAVWIIPEAVSFIIGANFPKRSH
jgi:hypothetical protein